jgi:hypothetical protein
MWAALLLGGLFFLLLGWQHHGNRNQFACHVFFLDGTRRFQVIIPEPVTVIIDRRCYHHHGFMVKVEVEVEVEVNLWLLAL